MKKSSYKILVKEKLILEYYSGEIRMDDLLYSKEIISEDKIYNPEFNIIHDFRDANFIMAKEDVDKIQDFFKAHPKIDYERSGAYLTSKPNEVVFATFFSDILKTFKIKTEIFSTVEASLTWISDEKISVAFIQELLEELKIQTNNVYNS